MTRRLLHALLLALAIGATGLPKAAVAGPTASEPAFVETVVREGTFVVGEAVRLVLRIGYDGRWFEAHGVPLFHQAMDVPIQADAPWLREVPDAVPARTTPVASEERGTATLAVNGEATRARHAADVERGGVRYAVLEVERVWRFTRPAEVVLAAPTLRFAQATAFREDLVHGRTAVDPKDVVVHGAPRTLHVAALPAEGQPPGFAGAVGRYTVRAETDRREVRVGEVFPLRLVVEGEGNLDLLPPPLPGDLTGFHVYGTLDDVAPGRRTLTYDVAALRDDVRAVPEIPFPHFDPGPPGAYRVARTAPIPLVVRLDGARRTAATPAQASVETGRPGWVLPVAAGGVALLALLGVALARRRRARRAAPAVDPDAERLRAAIAEARTAIARPGADLSEALARALAARLRCAPAAVVSPDLRARLVAAGLAPEAAARAAATMEAFVAARYGGAAAPASAAEDVLRDLE